MKARKGTVFMTSWGGAEPVNNCTQSQMARFASSVSPWLCDSPSQSWALLPPAPSPSVGPLCRRSHLHHGSSRHRLHRGPLSWLAFSTAPSSSCSRLLLGSSLHLLRPGPMNYVSFPLSTPPSLTFCGCEDVHFWEPGDL